MTESTLSNESGVRCTLLPVRGGHVLLPMLALVEVLGYEDPQKPAQSPPWYLGLLPWRGSRVPVVRLSYTAETETRSQQPARDRPRRIAICRGIDPDGAVPYFGVAIQSSPRVMEANLDNIEGWNPLEPEPDFLLKGVRLSGEEAWIPDMDALASSLAALA